MKVDFFTGILRTETGDEVAAYWAHTDAGDTAILDPSKEPFSIKDQSDILKKEPITSIDLLDLDKDLVQTIIDMILTRGYLKKPGIKDKGEAVLFVLVNEALQEMEEVARSEEI
ncbi:MAG: hypothetical protein ACLQPD_27395 [Desulfomonilaceae bacterium]